MRDVSLLAPGELAVVDQRAAALRDADAIVDRQEPFEVSGYELEYVGEWDDEDELDEDDDTPELE